MLASALALTLAACGSDNPTGTPDPTDPTDTSTPTETQTDTEEPEPPASLAGELNGAGASSQESAMDAWRAGFQSIHPDVTVNYDPVGSGGGRTAFIGGEVSFAGGDRVLNDEELAQAQDRCFGAEAVNLPLYISPIAVIYNIEGLDTQLQLSSTTLAGIFGQEITNWNAPEIAADNPGVDLPDLAVTPVNRSDDSGTTENFTQWLAATAGDAWPHEPSGAWPVGGGQSAQGTSGVVQTVQGGNGTIGYADASRAGDLGTVKIQVGDEWVPYSPEAAAAAVAASPRIERGTYDVSIDLDRTLTEPGTYPLVLVAYSIACTKYEDAAEGTLVKEFLSYIASAEGQNSAASAAGSAPISDDLRALVEQSIAAIEVG